MFILVKLWTSRKVSLENFVGVLDSVREKLSQEDKPTADGVERRLKTDSLYVDCFLFLKQEA